MNKPDCLRESEFNINKNIENGEFSQQDIYEMWQYIFYLENELGI